LLDQPSRSISVRPHELESEAQMIALVSETRDVVVARPDSDGFSQTTLDDPLGSSGSAVSVAVSGKRLLASRGDDADSQRLHYCCDADAAQLTDCAARDVTAPLFVQIVAVADDLFVARTEAGQLYRIDFDER
jgi:hypothetical protein